MRMDLSIWLLNIVQWPWEVFYNVVGYNAKCLTLYVRATHTSTSQVTKLK